MLQVFALDPPHSDDPDGSDYAIAYGVNRYVWPCSDFLRECPVGLECASSGDYADHCVDPATHKTPGATAVVPFGASFRIVVQRLLQGSTVELYGCACGDHCPADHFFSSDPQDCSVCGEDVSTTATEAGRCLDVNNDRFPDRFVLMPRVARIVCPGVSRWGVNGTYETQLGDGYYFPSGNQLAASGVGYASFGPGVVIEPAIALPTNSTCTIELSKTITDHDDHPLCEQPAAEFHTAALHAQLGARSGTTIELPFNAPVEPVTISSSSISLRRAGVAVADVNARVDGSLVTLDLGESLDPATTYEIFILTDVTDPYGRPLPAPQTLPFTTPG